MAGKKEKTESSSNTFTSTMRLSQMSVSPSPSKFIQPQSQRPTISLDYSNTLPTIDLFFLHHSSHRSKVVNEIGTACKDTGIFQVLNHGIPPSVINDAIEMAKEFFNLPEEEKMDHLSDNIHKPVRYGTSLNHTSDGVHFWRDFIKLYAYPISTWIHQWPSKPPTYREKMGNYATAIQQLHKELMQAILESLGLGSDYLKEDIQEGFQAMAVNCYPACPFPEQALGMPPHSDYGTITILAQNKNGLQIKDQDNSWINVPVIEGSLVVHVGDQLELISNGKYKSVIHRATVNTEKDRISIASQHSMGLKKKVMPAPELVTMENPASYEQGSFGEFLEYIDGNDFAKLGRYIDTLKKKPETGIRVHE